MVFELTDKLQDSIVSAMENQEKTFLVDASTCELVEVADDIVADDENFYELPLWDSTDGYKLREQFVDELHSPLAREDLLSVLRTGKGVFRGFKDVLKLYPQVGKRWHYYKSKTLRLYISEWYNELRETWGLEKYYYEPEDISDLVYEDFTLTEYSPSSDRELVQNEITTMNEGCSDWPKEVEDATSDLRRHQFEYGIDQTSGLICRSASQDFAGAILFSPCPSSAKKTVAITSFFVVVKYRGLGIGGELLSTALAELKKRGFVWILIAGAIVSDTMQPLLERSGFQKMESGFVANVFAQE